MSFFRREIPGKVEKKDIVSCETCGCLIERKHAQRIKLSSYFYPAPRYYCKSHKKPYRRVVIHVGYDKAPQFYGEVEMAEDGTPVGYKKIKT